MDALNNIAGFIIAIAFLWSIYAFFNYDWNGKIPLKGLPLPIGSEKKVYD